MSRQLIPLDDNYVSSEDSDFAPDFTLRDEELSDNDSQSDVDAAKNMAHRIHGTNTDIEEMDIDNSGDETVIVQAKKKDQKKTKIVSGERPKVGDEKDQHSLVKTRSMYAQDKEERKKINTSKASVTVNVDAVWQAMISGKPLPTPITESVMKTNAFSPTNRLRGSKDLETLQSSPDTVMDKGGDTMITIKRTYTFAGKVHEEERLVPRYSAEAKLYLATALNASKPSSISTASPVNPGKLKRPPKPAFRSIFEPVPENMPQRKDLNLGVRRVNKVPVASSATQEKKLNTVQKSAIDWAGFVDKEGISDELDAAGKSKDAYKAQQEFLARVEQKKVEQTRRAKGLPI